MSNKSFVDLPDEVLHRIFDHLDAQTILRSIRLVCSQFYTATENYNRFEINFCSSPEPVDKLILRLIQPGEIISVVFPDRSMKTSTIIALFLFDFNIHRLTRLRSLKFFQVATQFMKPDFHDLARRVLLPVGSTLQHLIIRICTYDEYQIILVNSPQLRTLVIDDCGMNETNETGCTSHTKLASLTITDCQLSIKNLQSLLSLTPSLVHLKISSSSTFDLIFKGSLWEEFIRIRLPSLKKFEFSFVYNFQNYGEVHSLGPIIDPFRTPFWLVDKCWIVTCDYVSRSPRIILYTRPAFKSNDQALVRCEASSNNTVCRMISLRTTKMTDAATEETLTALDLGGCEIGATGTQYLADELPSLTTLITLNLKGNHIGDEEARYLACALQNSSSLTTLHLENNQIGPSGAQHLGNALRINTKIVRVDLSFNQIKNEGTQHLANALRENTRLTSLNLKCNQIGNEGIQHLANALENNKTLTSLDLRGNNIGALGAQSLAVVLPNMALTTLDLGGNSIGAKVTRYLADALSNITTLITLDLRSNDIETPEAQYLADALRSNTTLTKLNLRGNFIERDTMQTIEKIPQKNAQMKNAT